jgi:hypothetical protein
VGRAGEMLVVSRVAVGAGGGVRGFRACRFCCVCSVGDYEGRARCWLVWWSCWSGTWGWRRLRWAGRGRSLSGAGKLWFSDAVSWWGAGSWGECRWVRAGRIVPGSKKQGHDRGVRLGLEERTGRGWSGRWLGVRVRVGGQSGDDGPEFLCEMTWTQRSIEESGGEGLTSMRMLPAVRAGEVRLGGGLVGWFGFGIFCLIFL